MAIDSAATASEYLEDGLEDFHLPDLNVNENGWGPVHVQEEQQPFIRFAPYSRSDRIGRVADWTGGRGDIGGPPDQYRRGDDRRRRMHLPSGHFYGSGVDSAFDFGDDREEDATFSLVDRSTPQKRPNFSRLWHTRGGHFGGRGGHANTYGRGHHHTGGFGQQQVRRDDRRAGGGYKRYNPWSEKITRLKEPSVPIESTWVEIGEFGFPMLSKLYYSVGDPVDLHFTGSIYAYDNNFEKARMKLSGTVLKADAPKPVDPPIMNDAYINEISSKFPDEFVVFTSDKVLSTLMCSISSVHPWDILIERKGNVLYLDKRPRGPIDVINVNETGSDVLLAEGNDVNTPNTSAFLSKEAAQYTRLVQYLSQDKGVCVKFSEPASAKVPAADKEKESGDALKDVKFPSGHCYRYRKWSLGEGMSLVCRLKIDLIKDLPNNSATPKEEYLSSDDVEHISGALSFQNIKVLNECDPKASNLPNPPQGWIKTLEANCGTVFANEVKNNNNKISRWTIESILGGVDMIRFAFVSRLNPKLITFPILLLVSSFPPRYIFDSMHFPSQESCWGIVKTFADHLRANIRDGSYFLIKDPNKAALKLFQCSVSNINEADEDANISITVQDESAL